MLERPHAVSQSTDETTKTSTKRITARITSFSSRQDPRRILPRLAPSRTLSRSAGSRAPGSARKQPIFGHDEHKLKGEHENDDRTFGPFERVRCHEPHD